jgi:3-phenylpropionate/trans-cinnamate dioxygenase ferredoxin reductase component
VTDPVVIIGNGVAGTACALRLGELGEPVVLVGPGAPHDRPPLSKRALVTGRVPLLADDAKLAKHHVTHIDATATLDLDARRVTLTPTDGADPFDLAASRLVWATGLAYPPPPIPGLTDPYHNTTAAGLDRLVAALAEPRRVVVIGAGLIGTETAATLRRLGHHVTLCDIVDRPLARFLPRVSDAAGATLVDLDVQFYGECAITRIEPGVVNTATHGAIPADVVISAAGFRSSLPEALRGDHPLAIDADATLRVTAHDNLWACGDCVRFPHPRFGRIVIPHWDHAVASGRHVAAAILGDTTPYSRDPYWFSDIGPLRLQQVGNADAAVSWRDEDNLVVGRDNDERACCVLLLNAPTRLREARELVAA